VERHLAGTQEPVLDGLDALREAVVLIRDLVLPGAEAPAAPDVVGFEGRQHDAQRAVAVE